MNTSGQPRLDYRKASAIALPALLALQRASDKSALEKPLVELVKLRASQINGCAYCMDLHFREARAAGEDEKRLVTLSAWEELDYFTAREKAALRWTEALTRLSAGGVPAETYDAVKPEFSDEELSELTLAIATINAWNRFAVGFAMPPRFA
jgi:AhpD family alkylhydroperoxidase